MHLLIKRVNELTIKGYTHFISSFANDTDVLLAQIIGSFRYKNKDLILEAVIPIENKLNSINENFTREMNTFGPLKYSERF